MKRISCITVVAFFVFCGIAHAGMVLLATHNGQAGAGVAPQDEARVEFTSELYTVGGAEPGPRLASGFCHTADQPVNRRDQRHDPVGLTEVDHAHHDTICRVSNRTPGSQSPTILVVRTHDAGRCVESQAHPPVNNSPGHAI